MDDQKDVSLPKPETDLPLPEKELESGKSNSEEQPIVKNEAPSPHGKSPILKFFLLGVIVVLIVLGLSGVYLMGRNSVFKELNPSAPSIPPKDPDTYKGTPTPDPTADWETYENAEYQFSIKYPSNINPQKINKSKNGSWELNFNDNNKRTYISVLYSINPTSGESGGPITEIESAFQGEKDAELFNLQGYPAVKFTEKGSDIESNKISVVKYQMILKDKKLWSITVNLNDDSKKETELANQILSTFKFTDSDSTMTISPTPTDEMTDWKKYSDVNYPFSLQYPSDWKLRTTYGKSVNNTNNYRIAGVDISSNLTSGSTLVVNVIDPKGMSFYDWMKSYSGFGLEIPAKPNSSYNGIPAYTHTYKNADGRADGVEVYYPLKDKIIFLGWNIYGYDKETADKIMSSLKFN